MSSKRLSSREMIFLLLQYMKEEKFDETVHMLEKESGVFFDMHYFESLVTNGNWKEVEEYLSGFIKVDENLYSRKILFEIQKQKYLEALDNHEYAEAAEILRNDLKVFLTYNEDVYKEMALLLCLQNFRENIQLSSYGDTGSARLIMLVELKKLIKENPVFREKLQFLTLKNYRLRTLLNQSLNWQHALCKNRKPLAEMKTLFADHKCGEQDGVLAQSIFTSPGPSQHDPVSPDRSSGQSDSTISCRADEDLPKTVVTNLRHSSAVKSMDFHPLQQTVLVVGTNIGDIYVWEVGIRERLTWKRFQDQTLGNSRVKQQASLATKYSATASVNRVRWSADGCFLGVAYSKHIVHLYSYSSGDNLNSHLVIDAHVGSVNDLAFSHLSKQLCVITCGNDKKIKVWNAATGAKQHIFDGHEAPVYSVYPYYKDNVPVMYSAAIDGKIRIWLRCDVVARAEIDAPGHACVTMAHSSDGTRFFSCGTSKNGDSHLIEWNENDGIVKRKYLGLRKHSVDVIRFDTTKNRFLAVGDEFAVKYWDMDNVNLLSTVDAGGGLELSPCIRFNKDGTLLAASATANGVKILANSKGAELMCSAENQAGQVSLAQATISVSVDGTSSNVADMDEPEKGDCDQNGDASNLSTIADDLAKFTLNMTEITEQSQICSLKLPSRLLSVKVVRLLYTSTGNCILALTDDGAHKLWKRQQNEKNVTGQATASASQLWQPRSGILMTNDLSKIKLEETVPCLALSKNNSNVVSASGGSISLFNIQTFERMTTFMPPQPAATCVVFHPEDNNVVAVGMEDSSIKIYNIRLNQVMYKLMGHRKRVTGLAFSSVLGILVSSAADAQVRVWTWSVNGWKKKASKSLQIPPGYAKEPLAQTRVQFHKDQSHVLVVHESKMAIYEASRLDSINQWVVGQSGVKMTDATYSCDGKLVYATFKDGSVSVFTAPGLTLRCRISPTSYLPSTTPSLTVYPLVIAAHPCKANQFAIGLTDGRVYILEPLKKWGTRA